MIDDAARSSPPPTPPRAHLEAGPEALWGRLGVRLEGNGSLKGEGRQFGGV